jgi:hypothetical protein
MNVLMLYPKFPEQTFWNTARTIKLLWGAQGDHAAARDSHYRQLSAGGFLSTPGRSQRRRIRKRLGVGGRRLLERHDGAGDDYRVCVASAKMRSKPIAVGGPFTHASSTRHLDAAGG